MAAERDIDDLPRNDANYAALTPLWFLERAALTHPARASVVHGPVRYTWADTYSRCRRLASALARRSVGHGSTVAVIAPNIPAIYETHFGVPMAGAVVNCVNIRLNAATVAFLLEHSSAEVVMVDQEFFSLAEESLRIIADQKKGAFKQPLLIVIGDQTCDPAALQDALRKGAIEYEAFLESGDPEFAWKPPQDEWKSIALGYTSGTTSNPKGVVLHHRGAYLMSLSAAVVWGMNEGAIYLWTLPMFHCNGWCYTWALAALCGTSICLRQVSAKAIFSAIAHQGVTHFCGAPVVLNTLVNAPPADTILPLPRVVNVMTAGAAPPPSVLAAMSKLGFRITHTYGLSETYGPSTVCAWKPEWDSLPADERARLHARQGIRYVGLEGLDVVDPKTMAPVPADGTTMGEIVMRGNGVMKGYLKNPKANAEAFENGWFHSGDLGVRHADGYIEVRDRAKDIIISGGENISSLEVEKAVYLHPEVLEASVVARADEQWGESPCAFVTLKDSVDRSDEPALARDIMRFCRERLPGYWVPKSVVFGPLPKTATGKIKKHELRAKAKELGPVRKSRM
ncbi:hypothetical protein GQ55_9G503900 [Panicum hallii var. hallii]|uniref:4-coumarate--CoA ligase n=2 Tax=Panicum hallii TaxID=206008 RepID=A0A2T7CDK5_9POAL|nr:acetate/butyrate--CoA ligase AAE7, peroxisomal-like [Panicum hallii]PUZ41426.1 hypothetical protein GQ55_9G503900 [Panicum hallii var. hallii]PVH32809.1 hypothetical protein PAHAL_9G493300 [Panicum hallii]